MLDWWTTGDGFESVGDGVPYRETSADFGSFAGSCSEGSGRITGERFEPVCAGRRPWLGPSPGNVSGTYDDQRGALRNVQLVMLKDGKQYTVTFTSSAAGFAGMTEAFKASLKSFTLGG